MTDEEMRIEAQDWMADCEDYAPGYYPPADDAISYVKRHYPGGWAAFVAEIGGAHAVLQQQTQQNLASATQAGEDAEKARELAEQIRAGK